MNALCINLTGLKTFFHNAINSAFFFKFDLIGKYNFKQVSYKVAAI